MKKYTLLLSLSCLVLLLCSCTGKGADLLILSWGDYMAEDVVSSFEEDHQVKVSVVTVDSNEQMYQNILNRQAEYDLVIPSDYMLDQMKED